ncbi:unnamed protein product [Urochloa decumbens]|uniref:Cytochrome P450 n=1 Tax=Urochloa decumbens TaxID=240449 RepID=A0ABC9C0J6_9POAL
MEDWLLYCFFSAMFCLVALSVLFSSSLRPAKGAKPSLPPGPSGLSSVIGPLIFLGWTSFGIDPIVRAARRLYGPVFTLHLLPSVPVIFVADRAVARRVLVQSGAAFADRPPANLATPVFSTDQHNVTSAPYGPLWRLLRRNLSSMVLHPSCLRRHAAARRRAASGLLAGVARQMMDGVVTVEGLLHHAVFDVFVDMCFGEGLGDGVVAAVTALQREFLTSVVGFQVLSSSSVVSKVLFRRRWKKMLSIRRRQEELFLPLVRARMAQMAAATAPPPECYADTLLDLQIPDDDDSGGLRNLREGEMVSLCSELLAGGTDSTVAVMQWTMANLVAHPGIQAKLRAEIRGVTGGVAIEEEHLPRMPYLRAVVLEGLRRHPPGRFMLPHAATEDGATLDGFAVPRNALVNFTLGGMAMDGEVWPDPGRFRPERFLTGRGPDWQQGDQDDAWFVANLVTEFEWSEVPGEPVDFAERQEMSVVMRQPLRAKVVPCS